jgi:hypothetical protein
VVDGGVEGGAVGGIGVAVRVVIEVASVPLPVLVEIELVEVGLGGTVVLLVEHAVAVQVVVTKVALGIAVQVLLRGVEEVRAVVLAVGQAVAVEVRVAEIPLAVLVGILLVRVEEAGAGIRALGHAVLVVVLVAGGPVVVLVAVELVGVGDEGAVVVEVGDLVAVLVLLAGIAGPVLVRVLLVRVGGQRAVVAGIGRAVLVVVEVAGIALLVQIRIRLAGVGEVGTVVLRVEHPVAILVEVARVAVAVAVQIGLEGVERLETVVQRIRDAVAVQVRVAGIADVVLIQIVLLRIVHRRAVVRGIGDGVPILVGLETVGLAVLVRVRETLVGLPVAVVVLAVTGLRAPGERGRVERLAVQLVEDAVVVVIPVHAVGQVVAVGIGEPLVEQRVAIIILAVAGLVCTGMDLRVERRAVLAVRDEVVVVVRVAGIAGRVEVEVHLVPVGLERAVVDDVRDSVPVLVGLETVGNAVPVGIGEPFVALPVAVVVLAVAGLHLGLGGPAQELAVRASLRSDASAEGVALDALLAPRPLVHLVVAVVVVAVAELPGRDLGITFGQAVRGAEALADARPPGIARRTVRGGAGIDRPLAAFTLLALGRNALHCRRAEDAQQFLALMPRRAGCSVRAGRAAEEPRRQEVDALIFARHVVDGAVGIEVTGAAQIHHPGGADIDLVRQAGEVEGALPAERAFLLAVLRALLAVGGLDARAGEALLVGLARVAGVARAGLAVEPRSDFGGIRGPGGLRQQLEADPGIGVRGSGLQPSRVAAVRGDGNLGRIAAAPDEQEGQRQEHTSGQSRHRTLPCVAT